MDDSRCRLVNVTGCNGFFKEHPTLDRNAEQHSNVFIGILLECTPLPQSVILVVVDFLKVRDNVLDASVTMNAFHRHADVMKRRHELGSN